MIRVLYFASLRERLGTGSEDVELPDGVTDLEGLTGFLARREGVWKEVFHSGQPLMMACNQEAAKPETPVADGDEIAFYPPVTGG